MTPIYRFAYPVLVVLAVVLAPVVALGDSCASPDLDLTVKSKDFGEIPLRLTPGGVSVGALDFNYVGDHEGWIVTHATGRDESKALSNPATQITLHRDTIEIRSLERRLGADEAPSPDIVLTAHLGTSGAEIKISAIGDSVIDSPSGLAHTLTNAHRHRRGPASSDASRREGLKVLDFSCAGVKVDGELVHRSEALRWTLARSARF
jgi:hypothetical protein